MERDLPSEIALLIHIGKSILALFCGLYRCSFPFFDLSTFVQYRYESYDI